MPNTFQPTAEGISLLSPYWNTIVGARQQGFNRAEVWGLINEQFQEGGPSFQGATIFDMNHYWSRAGELLNAETAFSQANPADAVEGSMWAWAPWAVPSSAEWQTPNYLLNYARSAMDAEGNLITDEEGNPVNIWGMTDWQGSIDVTAGDIVDRVLGSSESALDINSPRIGAQLADVGGIGFGDINTVQIMRF